MRPGRRHWLRIVFVAAALACQSEETRLAEHLHRAEAYLEQEKASEAIIEYKNALRIAPNDAAAHYGLAQAYQAAGDTSKAFWELQETVRLDPAHLEARLEYARYLVLGGKDELDQAIAQAEEVLAADPQNAQAHALKAAALERLKRYDEARSEYEAAVALDPASGDLLLGLAGFHVRRGDRSSAEPLFRKLTEIEPGFRAFVALAAFLARDPERDREAEEAYLQALEQAQDDEKRLAYQLAASFYFSRERYEDAERTLQQGLEATGNDLDLIYTLARLYHARGQKEKAEAMIVEATHARPDEARPFLVLSSFRGRNHDLEGALEAAEQAMAVEPDNVQARLRKAELLVEMGHRNRDPEKLAAGRAILDEVLGDDPRSSEANFVAAKLALAERRLDDAVASLRRTVDGRPDWPEAHFVLASALTMQGDRQEARAEALRALELDAQLLEARRLLARIYASLGNHELAAEEARKLLRQAPDDVQARVLLAQSLVRLGRTRPALRVLNELPPEQEGAESHYARGRILLVQGDVDGARAEILTALDERPENPDILEALVEIEARQGRLAAALERITKAREANPEDAALILLSARALFAAGRVDDAERELRRAVEVAPENLAAYQMLAGFLAGANRLDEGIATYRQALATRPDSAALHLGIGSLYEIQGGLDQAIEHYEAAVRLNPRIAEAKNNLAYLLAEKGENLDRALDLAQEAKRLLPEEPGVADTLGWVLYKKGIASAAINYLKEAEGGYDPWRPELGLVRIHLAKAYLGDEQPGAAREVLERALADLARAREAAQKQGRPAPPEPGWAAEARALLEQIEAASG